MLNDNRVALLAKKSREGKHVEDKEAAGDNLQEGDEASNSTKSGSAASSALSIMAVSGLLESVLCSSRDTTSPER